MIEIRQLTYHIQDKVILDCIDLDIRKNSIYGIIGPNGAGKSTLLKHIMGLIPVPTQTVFTEGKDILSFSTKDYAKKCSFVFQENGRDLDFTVEEMVGMGRYPYLDLFGNLTSEDQEMIHQILKDLGLEALKKRSIRHLSGGEAQKVFIGRALAQQTPLLLLDEPTSMLDIHNSIELLSVLKKIQQKYGLTIVMVMHDLNLAFQFCENMILLKNGKIILADTREVVLHSPELQEVYQHKLRILQDEEATYIVPRPLEKGVCL